ncbi:MAG: glutamyl-tRNA reductase [Verrucomicrobia bacterium]|nr:glutamyl-tRNA reductase [Verrucomicrobiota bacterium]MDE3099417.1 glutamyl-tRNA reductase [Verrucomicrobiota bacterium]
MIVVVGISHRTSPVELRERFAFAEADVPAALEELRRSGAVDEVVIVSTCNRVEIYAATRLDAPGAAAALKQFLFRRAQGKGVSSAAMPAQGGPPNAAAEGEFYVHAASQCLAHLFRVASGLDSMVPGETEILGQIKGAYQLAQRHGFTGLALNRAFQRALHAAKQVRTETNIQRGNVSVASVAVELAGKIFASVAGVAVLVLGAGDTSAKVARALQSRGAKRIVVAGRSLERAQALANEFGGQAVPFEDWPRHLDAIDIVISSTSAPQPVLDRRTLEPMMTARRDRPLLLIDIAVPRDVHPDVNILENVYLYDIDDLQAIADDYLKLRRDEIARGEAIIQENVRAIFERIQPQATAAPGTSAGLA